jgi:endoglucanase
MAVATVQEEIGARGAATAAHLANPHIGIAVDVSHATDSPGCDHRRHGATRLGAGPIICRGPNVNPRIFDRLIGVAKRMKIPHQIEGIPRTTTTDARAIQTDRGGVATALVSIPLRYIHTPSEVVDLGDVEHCIKLLVGFANHVKRGEYAHW